jgi:hypothetical protein
MVNAVQSSNGDFQVQSSSKTKMLFVDSSENVVSMGMLDSYATPDWIGNGSVVMADNFYQFQGANTNDGVWNQSVDTNQSYHMHNAYYNGGWKQHVADVSATMYQSGNGLHRFQVAPANSSADQSISWRALLNMNEADGFHWNPSDYSTADFRVESDSNVNMLVVDAGANQVVVGSAATVSNHALRVAGSVGGFGGDVATTTSGSSRTLDIPISDLGGGRGTYLASYYSYGNGGAQQNGFMCMVCVMTSPDRASGNVISERYATVTSITYSGANVRIVFTADGAYSHEGGKISLLKLA